MPILIRYTPSSLTRDQYDKVNEILRERSPGGPPPAIQLHVMFGEESDLRVSEIWESEEAWQQAWDGGLKAALDAAGRVEMAGCALPVLQYELENLAMVM